MLLCRHAQDALPKGSGPVRFVRGRSIWFTARLATIKLIGISMCMKLALLFIVLMLFCGCQPPSKARPTVETSFATPTATEVFNLRSKCAEFGEKILDGNIIGLALTQTQVSHYHPKTNRCYVELTVNMADLSKYEDYYARHLYDGQTGELLASVQRKKGVKTAFVKDSPNTFDWDAAIIKIDTLMTDGRMQ